MGKHAFWMASVQCLAKSLPQTPVCFPCLLGKLVSIFYKSNAQS